MKIIFFFVCDTQDLNLKEFLSIAMIKILLVSLLDSFIIEW